MKRKEGEKEEENSENEEEEKEGGNEKKSMGGLERESKRKCGIERAYMTMIIRKVEIREGNKYGVCT